MKVNTPDGLYRVELTANPLRDDQGQPLDSQANFAEKMLEICPTCLVSDRPAAVCHEAAHVWLRWAGLPQTEEQFCDLFSRMFMTLHADLAKQGGVDALLLMGTTPQERFDAACYSITLAEIGVEHLHQCFVCQQRIGLGSILASPPRHDAGVASMVVDMAFYCDSCDHIQSWVAFASQTGKPTGATAGVPMYLRGADRDRFLLEHGEKCGVMV